MPYLTYDEFKLLSQSDVTEEQFKKLLPKSSAVLNSATNFFYVRNPIELDNSWRVNQFKQALCAQIEYFHVLGASSFEEINSAPQTFSAGRTTVSNASRYKPSGANESKSLMAEDVFIYLEGTGLLGAAVSVW